MRTKTPIICQLHFVIESEHGICSDQGFEVTSISSCTNWNWGDFHPRNKLFVRVVL